MKPKTVFKDLILRILNGPIEDEWTIWTSTHKDVFKDVLEMSLTPTINIFLLEKVLYVGFGYWLEGLRDYHLKTGICTLPYITYYLPTYLPTYYSVLCYAALHYATLL